MKIAYLVLLHHQPIQAAKLIESLSGEKSFFFIHVDANADEQEFRKLLQARDSACKVSFIKDRVHGSWGGYSIVKATLNLTREAFFLHDEAFDYFILLSGQDYPIKPIDYINDFLEQYKGNDFIEFFELPSEKLHEKQGGLFRLNRYHYFINNNHKEFPPYSKKQILNPLFNIISKFYFSYIRKMPLSMKAYAGSQWWMLRRETVASLLDFLAKHRQVEHFFKNVWIPDELFFQIVIMHLNMNGDNIINDHYRYIEWGKNEYEIHRPLILRDIDLPAILDSKALFARKFDEKISAALTEKINQLILVTD